MTPTEGDVPPADPFAPAVGARDAARRLRGRLVSPVTVWTAGSLGGSLGVGSTRPVAATPPAAATVSSVLVAEGEPAVVLGLLSPLGELLEALEATGRFVVQVLGQHEVVLAERFSGALPAPLGAEGEGPFAGLGARDGPYGPILPGARARAACRVLECRPAGAQVLVAGAVEAVELEEAGSPLVHYRGRYRRLAPERG